MPTIVTVIGARPQFIKAAVVSQALANLHGVRELLLHTGQHYDVQMSDVFFGELGIPEPTWHLGVGSGPHGAQTGRMLEAIEEVLGQEAPDWVLVYGDTNSTLAGALAAAKLGIPVAHVEAGLRSFNRTMPEEINRVLTDHISDLLLVPTLTAMRHLAREGIPANRCALVGDVMYDVALQFEGEPGRNHGVLVREGLQAGRYVLATIHRAENTDSPKRLAAILGGLAGAATELPVILPLHPRTRASIERSGIGEAVQAQLRIVPPVGYLDMLALEKGAKLIVTDSGGVQKEAFFQRVPCLTLRDETEWSELVEVGWNRLVPPTSASAVTTAIREALERPIPSDPIEPLYGGGTAAKEIATLLSVTRPRGAA